MNTKDVRIKGCVTDSLTNMPIRNARVTLLCWYHAGWDKTDYVSIDTVSDKDGCFSAVFTEGYKVIIASVATNYPPALKESNEIDSKTIEINLKLKPVNPNAGLSKTSDINLRKFIVANSSN